MMVTDPFASAGDPPGADPTSPDRDLLTVTVRPAPSGATVLAVAGEVDLGTAPPLKDALFAQLCPESPGLVIDLTGVGFLGAAGLTVLVVVRDAAEAAGVAVCLVARTRPVLLPLRITGLDRVFDVFPSLADAWSFTGEGPEERDRHARSPGR